MTLSVRELGTVLGIWAHPDDETYLSGGLMARAAAGGQRVVCVTATAGERGSHDPAAPSAELEVRRRRELADALAILGVAEHHWLGHPDGGCADVSVAQAVGPLTELVREVAPDTVLTFGADGLTGHPDHVAVGAWAHAAVRVAGSTARVLAPARTADWIARFEPLHRLVNAFDDGLPVAVDREDLIVDLLLEAEDLACKVAALEAQASQTTPVIAAFGREQWSAWIATESFVDVTEPSA